MSKIIDLLPKSDSSESESSSISSTESLTSIDYFPLKCLNISVIDGPFLKDYYWESLKIYDFSDMLLKITDSSLLYVHDILIPSMPINTKSLKIVFHLMNKTLDAIEWEMKRIKLCSCKAIEIPKTINKYKKIYDCVHRNLIDIHPRYGLVEKNELTYFILNVEYIFSGMHDLAFEMIVSKTFRIRFNFKMEVYDFDPFKCILNNYLSPIYFDDEQLYYQPIWIYNPFNTHLNFHFETEESELNIETETLHIGKHCTKPLILKYDPDCLGNFQCNLKAKFVGTDKDSDDVKKSFSINVNVIQHPIPALSDCPDQDIPCKEAPFILYKNSISVTLTPMSCTTRMIMAHNHHNACVQFKWKNYSVRGLFDIEIEPSSKLLKPKYSTHFIVKIKSKQKSCLFKCVPVECDIYDGQKILLKKQLNNEIGGNINELISDTDDIDIDIRDRYENIKNSFITKILLNTNIEIKGKPLASMPKNDDLYKSQIDLHFQRTVYDKLCKMIRNFVFSNDFINNAVDYEELNYGSYTDLLNMRRRESVHEGFNELKKVPVIDKNMSLQIMQSLLTQAICEISSQRRFIPKEYAFPIKSELFDLKSLKKM